jgi:hypothetical protein
MPQTTRDSLPLTTDHSPLTNMKERKPFLLRMDPALFEALEGWAAQELRSLNGQIEYILKEAVARRRGEDKERGRQGDKEKKPS